MKKWLWAIVVVVVAVGVGGYSYTRYRLQEQSYTTEMKAGKRALHAKDYSQAVTNFTHATRTRASDTTAQRYLTQTQTYVDAAEALKARQFSAAKRDFKQVKQTRHASAVLTERAQDQLKTIKQVLAKRKTYRSQYQSALELNKANEFTDSNGVIKVMMQDKRFKQTHYQDIYKQATALRKQNNASIKALTGAAPIEDSTESALSASSSSSSQRHQAAQSQSTTAESDAATSSGKPTGLYTEAQINATRAELNEAGMKGSSMTDDQIIAILKRASAQHVSIAQAAKNTDYSAAQINATRAELDEAGYNSHNYTDAQVEAILQQASAQHMSIAQAAKSLQ